MSDEAAPAAPAGDPADERKKIAGRAGVVAAGTLASRVLGLVRDQVIAAIFPRAVTDAFFVAFTLPNVLRQLFAEGAVQSAVLPVLAATREREGEAAARRFYANVRGLWLVLLVIVSGLGVACAELLVELFATGFREIPGQFERTVQLTRWVFPYIFCMGSAALGVAALNTYQRFTVTAFAPALLNVAFVAFALLLPDWLGARGYDPALALAAAALVGGVLQVVAQWPSLAKIRYFVRPRFDFGDRGVRDVLRRMGPILIGMGVYYIDTLLARRFLSELGLGAQSYFSWALTLCNFPQGIFVMALQTAALPSLARLAARGERDELAATFAFGMRLTFFVALPATALAVALAEPLVVLLFQRGAFDAESSRETARALVAQGSGIWTVAVVRQLVGLYYALGDTRTPMLVAALDLMAFIVAALVLRGPLGHVGISAAVSVASAVQMTLLWHFARRRIPELGKHALFGSVARSVLASVVAVAAARSVLHVVSGMGVPLGAGAVLAGLAGVLGFGAGALAVGSGELRAVISRKRRPR